jgi:histone H3/H4
MYYPNRLRCLMADHIVKSQVKETLNVNVSSDFYEALDDRVEELLHEAQRRAESNDRSTVQPRDL